MNNISSNQHEVQAIASLHLRLGELHPMQIRAWQRMTPAQRLKITFQAYQFALNAVRASERRKHPQLPADEFEWLVTRRMQHNTHLGKPANGTPEL